MLIFTVDSVNVQLTREGADIFDLMKRRSDRSLPIDIPSTPEMDELFGSAFEVNRKLRDVDWNPNRKAEARLDSSDGMPLIKGYAQLMNITTHDEGIVYHVVVYGAIKDMFSAVGEKLLVGNEDSEDDLDFSEYEHDYEIAEFEKSWDLECEVSGVDTDLSGQGKGYVYPMIDTGTNVTNQARFKTLDWRPALFWREILYKIFQKAEVVWQSDFLDSAFFKNLIMPFAGDTFVYDSESMVNESASASQTGGALQRNFYNTPGGNGVPDRSTGEIIIFDNETSDPSNQYNPSNGEFTAAQDMEVVVEGHIIGTVKFTGGFTVIYPYAGDQKHYGDMRFEVIKDSGGGSYTPVAAPFGVRSYFTAVAGVTGDEVTTNDTTTIVTGQGYFQTAPFILKAGEKLYIKPYCWADDYYGNRFTNYVALIADNSFINILRTSTIVAGQRLDPTLSLPSNMKQKDFLSMVVKRFNIYMDPVDDRNIVMEPRNDFYTSETEIWEPYRATDQPLVFYPMALLNAKQYDFTHLRDEDLINKKYYDKWGYVYGRKRVFTENEFLKEVQEVNDQIAPTPSVSQIDRIIPSINYVTQTGQASQKATKVRMLYYGGLLDCQAWENDEDSNITSYTQYPYAGLQDTPFAPTFQLTYGIPNEVYVKSHPRFQEDGLVLKQSTNDIYTQYWEETILQISNRDSKVVTGWFWLDPVRYYGATLRKQYWFNNAYHRLLKIEDYVATDDVSLTKCTFLKLEKVELPSTTAVEIVGGRGGQGPIIDRTNTHRGPGDGTSTGNGGETSDNPSKGIVNAGATYLGPDTRNTTVLGGDGAQVPARMENVVMVNSELPPPGNDVMMLNNMPVYQTNRITLSASDLGDISTTPLIVVVNRVEGGVVDIIEAYGKMIFDTDVYQDRNITLVNDTGTDLFEFGTGFTDNIPDTRRKAQRLSYDLLPDEHIYIKADGIMTTGLGTLELTINYRNIPL